MTTLIFIRHGQSESNLEHRFTGQGNTCLTELGHLQAACTAEFLKDRRIDKIYASDLTRAMQTAEPTAKIHGLDVIPTASFREIDAGLWEGKYYSYLKNKFPESYDKWLHDIGRACPDGGESVLSLAKRIYDETDRILTEDRGKTVAIFTHATPVRVMGCRWLQIPIEDAVQVPFSGNASVSIAEYEDDGSFHLICYGYDKHQGEHATNLPSKYV